MLYEGLYLNGRLVDGQNIPKVGDTVYFDKGYLFSSPSNPETGNFMLSLSPSTAGGSTCYILPIVQSLDVELLNYSYQGDISDALDALGILLDNTINYLVCPVIYLSRRDEYSGNIYRMPFVLGPLSKPDRHEPNILNWSFSSSYLDTYPFLTMNDVYTKAESFAIGVLIVATTESRYTLVTDDSTFTFDLSSAVSQNISLSSLNEFNPFLFNKGDKQQKINALPFRAYEQIYNAFFRDERNNPLLINGKPYYDKYLPQIDGGLDTTRYDLHQRNWEQDFLTTSLPSPQQGNAPLVGLSTISATGVMTLSDDNGNVYQAQAVTADDNDTIIGAKFIETNQDGTNIPTSVARSLVNYASSGISINDFRNVNALQRYLETNLRRGLKYRDLISARWGVNISYAEMNMPEFIGGATSYINSAQVNQTSQDTESSPLGSFAGQLFVQGKSHHKIRHFCDEPGFIIGVVSFVPVPVYSQLLPKIFTKFDPLDFYNPEFGHIGLQPIPMKEVAPVQVALNNGNQDSTFGYQRAWYDYLGRVDEVHGDFRGSLRDFVMYRTFSGIPTLSEDFLLVDNKPLDNVFSVQTDVDGNSINKIMGQIYVDCVAKRPIPRFGVPRLE